MSFVPSHAETTSSIPQAYGEKTDLSGIVFKNVTFHGEGEKFPTFT